MVLEKNIEVYDNLVKFYYEYHLNNKEKEVSILKTRKYIFRANRISLHISLNWSMEYNNFKYSIQKSNRI